MEKANASLTYYLNKRISINNDIENELTKLTIQRSENDLFLISEKKAIYNDLVIGFSKPIELCKEIASWLNDIESGKVKRRQKDKRKDIYKVFIEQIESTTNLKIKSIDGFIYHTMDMIAVDIYMTLKTRDKVILTIPDVHNSYYDVDCMTVMKNPSSDEFHYKTFDMLMNLETSLYVLIKEDDICKEKKQICSFPTICDLSDFGAKYDEWYIKNHSKE
jgi:hypothetical protein